MKIRISTHLIQIASKMAMPNAQKRHAAASKM